MSDLEQMKKRWKELVGKPRTNEEVQETLLLAKKIELERAKEYKGLIDELAAIDIKISSIWDLVNTKNKYPKAIPLLIKYLPLVSYDRNKEAIVRALTISKARGISSALLLKEYLKLPNDKENLKWVIGNAINVTITKSEIKSIFPIVLNKENGLSRQMFIAALGKAKSQEVEDILINLLDDDEVTPYALQALGKMKSKKATEKITVLVNHSNPLIKKEAQKALKKVS